MGKMMYKKRKAKPKPPRRLYEEKNGVFVPVGAWACGECGEVHADESLCETCCKMRSCTLCGVQYENEPYSTCEPCLTKSRADAAKKRWDAMPVVDYNANHALYDDVTFYHDIDEYFDVKESHGESLAEYLEVCIRTPLNEVVTPYEIIDVINERVYEAFGEEYPLLGEGILYNHLDMFFKRQKDMFIYKQTGKKIKVSDYVASEIE